MKGFVKGMDNVFAAIVFSEVGEHGIAKEFLTAAAASHRMKTVTHIHSRPHIPLVPEGDP
jgi:hypothetical protein